MTEGVDPAQRASTRQITSRLPVLPTGSGRLARLRRALVARRLISNYMRDDGDALAQLIAFNALFSLVPFLLFLFTLVGFFARSETIFEQVESLFANLLPASATEQIMSAVERGRDNLGQLTVVTFVALLFGGARLFVSLDSAFARIYRTAPRRFLERRAAALVMVPLVSLLMIAGAIASSVATVMLALPDRLFESGEPRWYSGLLTFALSYATAYVMFWVLYAAIPSYQARTTALVAWPGALVAALLFVGLSQLFPLYVSLTRGMNLYGSAFALALVLLFWLYLLGQMLVIGAEVNALASGRRPLDPHLPPPQEPPSMP